MDNFIVSARKYRPATFQSVVGQNALVTTLKNAIVSNHLAHAYLFCGPRGVGKTTCARIFAKTINCQNLSPEGDACNACESCVSYNGQRSFNIHELDAASNNGIDEIKNLIDQVRVPPQIGKYSVYIIDEVHMLSSSAFNAFLKTLEEPPAHAIFILATTEKHKIIPTILSRCQIYDFNRITVADTVAHLQFVALQEKVTVAPEALNVIAQKSDGGMRDALSIFDQVVSFCGDNVTYEAVIENLNVLDYDYYFRLVHAFLAADVPQALVLFNEILSKGFDGNHFVSGLSAHLRDVLVCKDPQTVYLLEVGATIGDSYKNQALQCDIVFLYKALEIANECDLNYRQSKNKRLLIEIMLIRLCQLSDKKKNSIDDTESNVRLEKIFNAESTVQAVAQAATIEASKGQPATIQPAVATPVVQVQPQVTESKQSVLPTMPKGISIKKTTASEPEKIREEIIVSSRNTPFTQDQLHTAWNAFVDQIPDQIHLARTIIANQPLLTENTCFEIRVQNSFQAKEMNDIRSKLLSFLAEKLSNDCLEMKLIIEDAPVSEHRALLAKEKFDLLIQKNEHLKKMVSELGLEIS